MAYSKNRFALLEDEADDQPGHGAEDTLDPSASPGSRNKKKKAKKSMEIPSDLRGDTVRYFQIFFTFFEL